MSWMKRSQFVAVTACALAVWLSGCGGSSTQSSSSTGNNNNSTGTPAKYVYVIQQNPYTGTLSSTILQFPASSNGARTPSATLSVPSLWVTSIAFDASGQMYVGGYNINSVNVVNVYAAGATGSATPVRTFQYNTIYYPEGMAVDASQNVYVVDGTGAVSIFASTATGTVSPAKQIIGSNTGMGYPTGLALDSSGNIYVSNEATSYASTQILVFAAGATGNVAPTHTINVTSSTQAFFGVAVDSNKNVLATLGTLSAPYSSSVVMYSSTASGSASPVLTISGSNTGLATTGDLAVDGAGTIYVTNEAKSSSSSGYTVSLVTFSESQTGNVTPTENFTSTSWTTPAPPLAIQ